MLLVTFCIACKLGLYMGNRKISVDLKMCALSLWDQGWQVEDIVDALLIGIVTGYPGVFQGNLHLHPHKPPPTAKGRGFSRYGCGLFQTHGSHV